MANNTAHSVAPDQEASAPVRTGRASAGVFDDRAVALTGFFEAVETTHIDYEGLSPTEQDKRYESVKDEKRFAFAAAAEAWWALARSDDPEHALVALISVGELNLSWAQARRELDHPSHYSGQASGLRRYVMNQKASRSEPYAFDCFTRAREIAITQGFGADLEFLNGRLADLQRVLDQRQWDPVGEIDDSDGWLDQTL